MRIAIHQPNLIPHLAFFHKMEKCDIFVLMINCQFEKNGFQNRMKVRDKWITKPVVGGTCMIKDKFYTDGTKLIDVNAHLIIGLAKLLGINASKIHYDFETNEKGTERLIEICHRFKCDKYLTNPDATNKYLDEERMNGACIDVVPCDLPKEHKKSMFEALEEYGIEGCKEIIRKDWNLTKSGDKK